ncbi:MAG: 2-oxo acid dehydrogenase subunit E2 [Clostridia bacterium]|nr:2-oxo acid dehydrogenase subunit E2 [Clostridia bacterium]
MENKRRRGDRPDAREVRGLDSMHVIMPYIYLDRADNEAFISETIELDEVNKYLEMKNANSQNGRYTLFHAIIAAVVKTITLRPDMNRFIKNRRIYQRDEVSCAFVVKRQFADGAHEGLAFVKFGPDSTMDLVHERIMEQINVCRSEKKDDANNVMDVLCKMPRPILSFVMAILRLLDEKGKLPQSLMSVDPNHATVFLSNLGSIGLKAGYHHLFNWGTTSVFIVVGKIRTQRKVNEDGCVTSHEVVDIGITLDERIADGYYYSQTVKLLKKLLTQPELLDKPAKEPVIL